MQSGKFLQQALKGNSENFSVERRKVLRFLGAKVVLTHAIEKGIGMIRKANDPSDYESELSRKARGFAAWVMLQMT